MKHTFNWKAGIWAGVVVLIVGIGTFVTLGTTVDYNCQNGITKTTACRVYAGFNTGVSTYADVWRYIFARRCVGGKGPDDCIAPDMMIMASTLFALGFVVGGFLWRKKPPTAAMTRPI